MKIRALYAALLAVASLGCRGKKSDAGGSYAEKVAIYAPQVENALGVKFKTPPKLEGMWMAAVSNDFTTWAGPWGVSYTANLTPDQNTGLGIWTEDMFVNALKQGKHMGKSRPILPPMPWNWYGQLPEEDLKAMFAYLRSIPAVANRVPIPLTPDGKPIEQP